MYRLPNIFVRTVWVYSIAWQLLACSQEVEFGGANRTLEAQMNMATAQSPGPGGAPKEKSCSIRRSPDKPAVNATTYISVTPTGFAPHKGSFTVDAGQEISLACADNLCMGSYVATGGAGVVEASLFIKGDDSAIKCKTTDAKTLYAEADSSDSPGAPNYSSDTANAPDNMTDTATSKPNTPQNIADTSGAQYLQNTPDTSTTVPPAPEYIEKTFSFKLTENVNTVAPKEIEIVLIIDDSASMTNKIKRLTTSISNVAGQLIGVSGVKVNMSYILLSEYLSGMYGVDFGEKYVRSNPFVFNSVDSFSLMNGKVTAHADTRNLLGTHLVKNMTASQLTQWVNTLKNIPASSFLDREAGIGAIMDNLNARDYAPNRMPIQSGSPIHYILLSDEDNTRLRSVLTNKYDKELETHPTNVAYFSFDYTYKRNQCAEMGFSTATNPYSAFYLRQKSRCVFKSSGFSAAEAKKYISTGYPEPKVSIYRTKRPDGSEYIKSLPSGQLPQDCSYYKTYSCVRNVDGVDVSFNDVGFYFTYKSNYSSCTPNLSSGKEFSSPGDSSKFAVPIECRSMPETPLSYIPNLVYKMGGGGRTYTSISSAACGSDEELLLIDGFSYQWPIASRPSTDPTAKEPYFCPQQVEGTTLSSDLDWSMDEPWTENKVATIIGSSDLEAMNLGNFQSLLSSVYTKINYTLAKFQWIPFVPRPRPTQYFRDSPESAVDFFTKLFPDNRVYVHSLVKQQAGSCPGDAADSSAAKVARDYIRLSKLTGGISLDICAANFDPLVSQIFNFVQRTAVWNYDLKSIVDKDTLAWLDYWKVIKVVNKTKGQTLSSDTYTLQLDQIGLQQGVAAINDQIEITLRMPKSATKPTPPSSEIPDGEYADGGAHVNDVPLRTNVTPDKGLNVAVAYSRAPGLAPFDCSQAQVVAIPGSDGGLTVSGLRAGTQYNMRVCVRDRNGGVSRGRILTITTLASGTNTASDAASSDNSVPSDLLPSCRSKMATWTSELYQRRDTAEYSTTKLCTCSGFLNGSPRGPDTAGTGYVLLGDYSYPCTAATQQGVIDANDNDAPIKLTLFKGATSNSYGPFTGKTMNDVVSRSDGSGQYMFRISKP